MAFDVEYYYSIQSLKTTGEKYSCIINRGDVAISFIIKIEHTDWLLSSPVTDTLIRGFLPFLEACQSPLA